MELAIHIFTKSETKVFTLWGLSTENLKNRSQEELEYLFVLYEEITQQLYDTLHKEQVNFWVAGDIDQLPEHLKNRLLAKQKEYHYPTDRWFVLAINYWGQDEILRGIKSLISSGESISELLEEVVIPKFHPYQYQIKFNPRIIKDFPQLFFKKNKYYFIKSKVYIYIYLLYILKHSTLEGTFVNASIASATQESIFRQPKIYLYKNITMVFVIQLQNYDKTFK